METSSQGKKVVAVIIMTGSLKKESGDILIFNRINLELTVTWEKDTGISR
jgi:hypothetical protein